MQAAPPLPSSDARDHELSWWRWRALGPAVARRSFSWWSASALTSAASASSPASCRKGLPPLRVSVQRTTDPRETTTWPSPPEGRSTSCARGTPGSTSARSDGGAALGTRLSCNASEPSARPRPRRWPAPAWSRHKQVAAAVAAGGTARPSETHAHAARSRSHNRMVDAASGRLPAVSSRRCAGATAVSSAPPRSCGSGNVSHALTSRWRPACSKLLQCCTTPPECARSKCARVPSSSSSALGWATPLAKQLTRTPERASHTHTRRSAPPQIPSASGDRGCIATAWVGAREVLSAITRDGSPHAGAGAGAVRRAARAGLPSPAATPRDWPSASAGPARLEPAASAAQCAGVADRAGGEMAPTASRIRWRTGGKGSHQSRLVSASSSWGGVRSLVPVASPPSAPPSRRRRQRWSCRCASASRRRTWRARTCATCARTCGLASQPAARSASRSRASASSTSGSADSAADAPQR
mmetsp:Transcript_16858/g.51006  ORF Transcript_16858/g.51006 Transcript_16858/m.51006 type:complete len:471 (-) Transcript_16858:1486-2898(-)